jgi:hypothetical protein
VHHQERRREIQDIFNSRLENIYLENDITFGKARQYRSIAQVLDDEKEVVLEREDIKQQSAKIMELLKLANKKWEEDEKAAEDVEREAPPVDVQDKRAKMVERLARPKRVIS